MKNYNYSNILEGIWFKAVEGYQAGKRDANKLFNKAEIAFLSSIGVKPCEVYDYAEDFIDSEEPDLSTFMLVHSVRRDYFIKVQKCKISKKVVMADKLPPKTEALGGIPWLPRIIAKARAKLKGELDPNIMYGCGGDRAFFKAYDIHPKDFLIAVWMNELEKKTPQALVRWVKSQKK